MSTITNHSTNEYFHLLIGNRIAEDPRRAPHEKELAIHVEGDSSRATISSFKRVVFEKLLRHPRFDVIHLNVIDGDGNETTATRVEAVENPDLTVIGVYGTIPVGCLSIGVGRNDDTHAEVVK